MVSVRFATPGRPCAFDRRQSCRARCGFMVLGKCGMLGEPRDALQCRPCDPAAWARAQLRSLDDGILYQNRYMDDTGR